LTRERSNVGYLPKGKTKKPLRANLEALTSLSNIAPQRLLSIGMWNK